MITLITSNEEDRKIGHRHAVNIVDKLAEAADHGWSVWHDSYTKAGSRRKRPWAVGKVRWSTFMGCSISGAFSHHGTAEAAITRAKEEAASCRIAASAGSAAEWQGRRAYQPPMIQETNH